MCRLIEIKKSRTVCAGMKSNYLFFFDKIKHAPKMHTAACENTSESHIPLLPNQTGRIIRRIGVSKRGSIYVRKFEIFASFLA